MPDIVQILLTLIMLIILMTLFMQKEQVIFNLKHCTNYSTSLRNYVNGFLFQFLKNMLLWDIRRPSVSIVMRLCGKRKDVIKTLRRGSPFSQIAAKRDRLFYQKIQGLRRIYGSCIMILLRVNISRNAVAFIIQYLLLHQPVERLIIRLITVVDLTCTV